MKYKQLIKWQLRPLIYATILTIGFGILINFLEVFKHIYFLVGSIVLYIIVLAELLVSSNFYHIYHRQNTHAVYDFESHKLVQFSHHLVLPSLLYWGITLFFNFNSEPEFYLFILILAFFSFLILFENISSFYKHSFSLNKSTNYIYDFITILCVYIWSFICIELIINYGINNILIYFIYSIIITILCFLSYFRHLIHKSIILYNIIYVFTHLILTYLLLTTSNLTINSITFILSLCFIVYTYALSNSEAKFISKTELIDISITFMLILALLNLYY